jgi:hypothetical protein
MPTTVIKPGTPAFAKEATDKALKSLLKGPKTLVQINATRHRVLTMLDAKLIKRAGAAKNEANGRNAVTYELTAKGRKRAERL